MWPLGAATPVPLPTDPGPIVVAVITAASAIVVAIITSRRRTDPSPPAATSETDVAQSVSIWVLEQNMADAARVGRQNRDAIRDLRRDFDEHVRRCEGDT